MKMITKSLLVLTILAATINGAAAGTTYYNYSNGISGTASTYGNTTYYNYSNGVSGTASRY